MVLSRFTCPCLLFRVRGYTVHVFNQSVENAGVAFVKGANERNKFFEKVDEQ